MKMYSLAVVIGAGSSFVACGQDVRQNEIPSVVINAFQAKFPNAGEVDWEKKGDVFFVEFEIGETDHEAWLDAAGKITKHEQEMAGSEIPAIVRQAATSQFKGYKIDDAEQIEKDGKTYYEIELDGKMGDRKVVLDETGKLITDTAFLY